MSWCKEGPAVHFFCNMGQVCAVFIDPDVLRDAGTDELSSKTAMLYDIIYALTPRILRDHRAKLAEEFADVRIRDQEEMADAIVERSVRLDGTVDVSQWVSKD